MCVESLFVAARALQQLGTLAESVARSLCDTADACLFGARRLPSFRPPSWCTVRREEIVVSGEETANGVSVLGHTFATARPVSVSKSLRWGLAGLDSSKETWSGLVSDLTRAGFPAIGVRPPHTSQHQTVNAP